MPELRGLYSERLELQGPLVNCLSSTVLLVKCLNSTALLVNCLSSTTFLVNCLSSTTVHEVRGGMVKLSSRVLQELQIKNFLDLGGSIFFFNGLVRPPTLNFLYFFLAIMVPYGPNINVPAFPRFFFLKSGLSAAL